MAEFLNDAVKFYINYLEERRYHEEQYQKYLKERNKTI